MKSRDVIVKALIVCLLLAAGCSDDGKKKSDNDAGPDGGGGPDSISFVVVVWEEDAYVPQEGATVAFDAPGGARSEAVTGADGLVTFDGFDWSVGEAAATAHVADSILASRVGLDADHADNFYVIDGAVVLEVVPLEADTPETVTVSGTVTGFLDTAHGLVVNVVDGTAESQWIGASDGTFSVPVISGEPFTIQAVEYVENAAPPSGQGYSQDMFQWMQQTFDPITEDLTGVELDFNGNALEMFTADVTIDVPDREESPVCAGTGVGLVCDRDYAYCQGWGTAVDISEDGSQFEASLLWVEPDYLESVITLFRVYEQNSWRFLTISYLDGYPEDGASLGTLLDVPEWVSPEPGDPHQLHDAIEWNMYDEGLPIVALQISLGTQYVWEVVAPSDSTTITVPDPPSSLDAEDLLGTGALSASLVVGEWDWEDQFWTSVSVSQTIYLQQ